MELKPIKQAKQDFINGAPPGKAVKAPAGKLKKLSDATGRYAKFLLFGDYGSGKTYFIVGLLLEGLKVLVLTTDIGGDGLATIVAELNRLGRGDLKDNIIHIVLPTHDDVATFFKDPQQYWDPELGAETIWDFGIDVLFWDGFTGYQQIQLADYVETSDPSVLDREGNLDTQKYWGAIRRETARALDRFLGLHNRKTGQLWHKVMTCLDNATMTDAQALSVASTSDDKEKRRKQSVKEAIGPFIQGSAAKLMGPAFDLVIYAHAKAVMDNERQVMRYTYQTMKNDKMKVKSRGVDLSSLMIDPKKVIYRAEPQEVWRLTCQQLDIPVKVGKEAA